MASHRVLVWAPVGVALALVIVFLGVERFAILPDIGKAAGGTLSDIQKAALDTTKELTQLFITWSLAIIGGVAYFLKAAVEGDKDISRPTLLAAEAVILCAVVSVFFGHMTLTAIVDMLALDLFNIRDHAVLTYGVLQYFGFLVTLLAFFAFIHFMYWSSIVKSPREQRS